MRVDGRRFVAEREVETRRRDDGRIELVAPAPGLFRGGSAEGALVSGGGVLGELEVLGTRVRLRVPADAYGVVVELPPGRRLARRPVDVTTVLAVLDPEGAAVGKVSGESAAAAASSGGPVFRTPLGGRYRHRAPTRSCSRATRCGRA